MKFFLGELSLAAAIAINSAIVASANQRFRNEENYHLNIVNLISMFDAFYSSAKIENISHIATVITGKIVYNHLIDISDIMTACHTIYSNAATFGIIKNSFENDNEILTVVDAYKDITSVDSLISEDEPTEFAVAYISVMLCTWLAIESGGKVINNYEELLRNKLKFLTRYRRIGNVSPEEKMNMIKIFKDIQNDLDLISAKLDEDMQKLKEGTNDEI